MPFRKAPTRDYSNSMIATGWGLVGKFVLLLVLFALFVLVVNFFWYFVAALLCAAFVYVLMNFDRFSKIGHSRR